MTYNVFGGILNLALSIYLLLRLDRDPMTLIYALDLKILTMDGPAHHQK